MATCALSFNGFSEKIISSLSNLREAGELFDITLVCEDGVKVGAHKVVLAACSPFFRSILEEASHPHPLVYLRGIKGGIVENLVTFFYQGEVTVSENEAEMFLSLCEEMGVNAPGPFGPKEDTKSEHIDDTMYIQETKDVVSHVKTETDMDLLRVFVEEKKPLTNTVKRESTFQCDFPNCEYTTIRPRSLRLHIESNHEVRKNPVVCSSPYCSKTFPTRQEYREHKLRCVLKCETEGCGREFRRPEKFEGHQRSHASGRLPKGPTVVAPQELSDDSEAKLKEMWELINKGKQL